MSELDKAHEIDLAERAEQLSGEAERIRNENPLSDEVKIGNEKLDEAVTTSVKKLRKLAEH